MLRSLTEPEGYRLDAIDGDIGRCKDFLFNDGSWALHALVVDSSRLPLSKKVLVPVGAVTAIDWVAREVRANVPADFIDEAPPFDPNAPINVRLEAVRYDTVGRPYGAL